MKYPVSKSTPDEVAEADMQRLDMQRSDDMQRSEDWRTRAWQVAAGALQTDGDLNGDPKDTCLVIQKTRVLRHVPCVLGPRHKW